MLQIRHTSKLEFQGTANFAAADLLTAENEPLPTMVFD
jgi:hypothetical protein